jgi:carboxyl-terminal processing protease
MKRMEESKGIYEEIMNVPFDYSMRALTLTTIKHLMQNTAELTERWRKQIKLSALSSLTERLRVQENKNKGLEGQSEKIH